MAAVTGSLGSPPPAPAELRAGLLGWGANEGADHQLADAVRARRDPKAGRAGTRGIRLRQLRGLAGQPLSLPGRSLHHRVAVGRSGAVRGGTRANRKAEPDRARAADVRGGLL